MSQWIEEQGRRTPVLDSVDVFIAGAGSAGVAAAVGAAESGATTMLVDAEGTVGGTLANQLLEHSAGFLGADGAPIVGGVGGRIISRLQEMGGSPGHQPDHSRYQGGRTPINHAELKLAEAVMLEEAGVRLLLRSPVVGVTHQGQAIKTAIIEGKSGRYAVHARTFVDCTGDADLAALAQCDFHEDNLDAIQPASLLFKLGGIDFRQLLNYVATQRSDFLEGSLIPKITEPYVTLWGFGELLARGHAAGMLSLLRAQLHFGGWPSRGEAVINFTRVDGQQALDARYTGRALPTLSRQVLEFARFFRELVPGCQNAYVVDVASRVGVRETRRVKGLYTLTYDDVARGARFPDAITQCAHPIDIHGSDSDMTYTEKLQGTHDIPYRCLIPTVTRNLLVAGRCISCTHEAHGALRCTAQCFGMGEAAGVAAALCSARDIAPADLDYASLKDKLKSRGALFAKGNEMAQGTSYATA